MTQKPDIDLSAGETLHSATAAPLVKRKCRWFWRILFLFLFLIGTLLAFLATGTGQRLALNWVDKALDELSFGQIEGSLQNGLSLHNTAFQMDGVETQFGKIQLHIGFGCLLDRRACVENIAVQDAQIRVDTAKLPPAKPKEEKPLGEITLPLPVALNKLSLDNIHVQVDDMVIELDHFHSGLKGEGNYLQLAPTVLQHLKIALPEVNENMQAVRSREKVANNAPLDWQALKQQLAQPLLTKLEPITLPLHIDIPDFSARDIKIEQQKPIIHISSVDLVAKSNDTAIDLNRLDIQTDKGNLAGQGTLALEGNYPLKWALTADVPNLPEFQLPASQVHASLFGELFGKTQLLIKTSGAVAAEVQGEVQLAEPKTPLNLTMSSQEVRYPFMEANGANTVKLKKLNIALLGDLLNYQLDGRVSISGKEIPSSDITLKGKGELTSFALENLTLNALQGQGNIAGQIDWSTGIEWQSKVNLNGINTKSLLPEWAAVLSGELQTKGFAGRGEQGEQWRVEVPEMDLNGSLFNKHLQLKGELTADSQTLLNIPNAMLIYGENHIALKGVLGEKSDFTATIKAPDLQGLVPNFKASVNGDIRLKGKLSEPSADLDLVAHNIRYDQTALQHLTAKGKITTAERIMGDIELGVRQFSHNDINIENAQIIAVGSEQDHTLKLTSKGDPVAANLQLAGSFDRDQQRWKGTLSHIAIQSPLGEWKNDKTLAVAYHNKGMQADISAHCWHNPHINICFPQAFKVGKEGKVPFEIASFDLAALQKFLDKESQLSGKISLKGDAAWFTEKSPAVNIELNSAGIHLIQKIDHKNLPITITPVKIKASLLDNNLKLHTDLRLENNGRLVSDLLMKDIEKTRALSGNIDLEKFNLSLARALLSNGDHVEGNLNARLTVGGTALAPLLYGNLNLTGLVAKSAIMPFDLTGGNLVANFNGASSTLKGNLQTKESNLFLEGDANWQKLDAWHTRIRAKANRFRVNIPSIARVDVSPNIEVKATPRELLLSGTVDVPWARIVVEELPESAVTVSSDEIIMQGTKSTHLSAAQRASKNITLPEEMGKGMPIKADITVNIGSDPKEAVNLNAYGFKADLQGMLKVRQGSKGLGLYGQVNVVNGKFASFGQDLVVRKGVVSFTGLPSQPALDVEAIRNPEAMEDPSIVAGVRVTGVADAPEVKVFSNPPMAQDQALSYILTGRSLDNSNDAGSSNSIAAALIGMSLSKSSKVVGGIGSTFGITDLNVSTAGIGDNTKVVVSGSLTPKFKVKYGVGIFAPLTELTLRYRLAPSLYLQSISSVNQAIDLMYRFEFD